jgi:molybdate transport system ATP-binding protein
MSIRADLGLRRGEFVLDLAFSAPSGQTLALLGSNGAGKSTALAAMAGLLALDRGELIIDDRILERVATQIRLAPQARDVGVLFQGLALFESMSALDNVAYGPRARGLSKAAAREQAHTWLARFGVTELAERRPRELSGGQAQAVALARALIVSPRLLLLDEPLVSLDAENRIEARAVLQQALREFEGVSVIVTHEIGDALHLADRVLVIEASKLVQAGTPRQIVEQPATDHLRAMVETSRLSQIS